MKNIYLILLLLFPLSGRTQYKTTYNVNGDPLSEIVDANSMRQGNWTYYSYIDIQIRVEEYQNDILTDRKHIINNVYLNTTLYSEEKLTVNNQDLLVFTELQQNASGEILIDQNGGIVQVFFYNITDISKIATYTSSLSSFISNMQLSNRILTF